MSWNKTVIIDTCQTSVQIEADIERLFDFTDIVKRQPDASKAQVNAAIAAVKVLRDTVFVPFCDNLSVHVSGHSETKDPSFIPDYITVRLCVTTNPPESPKAV